MINLDKLYLHIAGRTDGFDNSIPQSIFHRYWSQTVDVDEFISKMDKSKYVDIVDGLQSFITAYAPSNRITLDKFIQIHLDWFGCDRLHYKEVIDSIWNQPQVE